MKFKGLFIMILLLFVTACGVQEEASPAPKKEKPQSITVANRSQPITEQTNLLVDEKKGFFKDKGLDVKVIPGVGGGDAIKNILSGQADIAFTDPGSLFFALDQ